MHELRQVLLFIHDKFSLRTNSGGFQRQQIFDARCCYFWVEEKILSGKK